MSDDVIIFIVLVVFFIPSSIMLYKSNQLQKRIHKRKMKLLKEIENNKRFIWGEE